MTEKKRAALFIMPIKLFEAVVLIIIGFALLLTLEEAVALGGGALGFLFFFGGVLALFCGGSMLRHDTLFPPGG